MEIGRKCPYGEALDKPIKCQRTDGGNEFITHNNNKGHLQHQVQCMFYNHVLLSVLHKMFYWHFLPVEECALANKKQNILADIRHRRDKTSHIQCWEKVLEQD